MLWVLNNIEFINNKIIKYKIGLYNLNYIGLPQILTKYDYVLQARENYFLVFSLVTV